MQSSGESDSWIWREWFDVAPGGEAVDLRDLVPGIDRTTRAQSISGEQRRTSEAKRRKSIARAKKQRRTSEGQAKSKRRISEGQA
ncbi:MAG: hypothetical protein KAW84_06740 [Thermoplasmata archaeon]|nr:hypothetical protein [Thermoplasmata archaeon]